MSSTTTQQVTVILVTYNSKAIVGSALKTIPDGVPTIVVDNASSDGTVEYIRECFPQVKVIESPQNIGFGPANNIALERVETPFSLLMNPDACFVNSETIDDLLEAAERYPDAAILGPGIVDENGQAQLTLPAPLLHRKEINRNTSFAMDDVAGDVCAFTLSGAVMFLRMPAFAEQAYYFDPNIFLYFEDDEICMRMRKAEYSLMLLPHITVMHQEGMSSPTSLNIEVLKQRHKMFSHLYIRAKYVNLNETRMKAVRTLLRGSIVGFISLIIGNRRRYKMNVALCKASVEFLCMRPE